jgi:hypothetical protein
MKMIADILQNNEGLPCLLEWKIELDYIEGGRVCNSQAHKALSSILKRMGEVLPPVHRVYRMPKRKSASSMRVVVPPPGMRSCQYHVRAPIE